MDKTTTQILAILNSTQQQEILEKAVKCLQQKVRVIVSNLPADKLIIAHDYLMELTKKDVHTTNRPPPSYISTPEDNDVDYSDMPPLVEDTPTLVKNIYSGWNPCSSTKPVYFRNHTSGW
jgi:hypothetical protein